MARQVASEDEGKEKREPLEGEIVADEALTGAEIIKAQTSAEIDVAVRTANLYPRKMNEVRQKLLQYATIDAEIAGECFYSKPVGEGGVAEGPSIRLAELVSCTYKNLVSGARIIAQDNGKGVITAQGVAWDMENNNRLAIEVSRSIKKRGGTLFSPAQIEVAKAALCSIARRNAIFGVVPTAVIKTEMDAIRSCARGTKKDLDARRTAMLEYFKKQGIAAQSVCKYLGRPDSAEITADDLVNLRGLVNAVRDGDYPSIQDAFAEVSGQTPPSDDALAPGTHKAATEAVEKAETVTTPTLPSPPAPAPDTATTPAPAPTEESKRAIAQDIIRMLGGKAGPFKTALQMMLGRAPSREEATQSFMRWRHQELVEIRKHLKSVLNELDAPAPAPEPDGELRIPELPLDANIDALRNHIALLTKGKPGLLIKGIMAVDTLDCDEAAATALAADLSDCDDFTLWRIVGSVEGILRAGADG